MTRLQKIQLKMSEYRQALNTLLDAENRTDEQQADLEKRTGEIRGMEPELRAAIAAEPPAGETLTAPMDTEDRERLEIRNRTGFRDYLIAALSGSPVSGAAAEFNASCHVSSGDHVPRELFDAPAREMRQRLEHRAVTPGPAIDAAAQPTIPFLFEASVLPTLLVEFPSVQSGVQQIPAITTAPPAGVVAKDADAASTAAAYTLVSRSPKRLAGAVEFRVEDLAVHSTLESDLSSALQESLSNQLDESRFQRRRRDGAVRPVSSGDERIGVRHDRHLPARLGGVRVACRWPVCAGHESPPRRDRLQNLRGVHGALPRRIGRRDVVRKAARRSWARWKSATVCRAFRAALRKAS